MSTYRAPTSDMLWTLTEVAGLDDIARLDGYEHADRSTITSVLDEAARFMSDVIAPLSRVGDIEGSRLTDAGDVTTPEGYADAYRKLVDAGWPAAAFPAAWGGGGLPRVAGLAIQEMLTSADMALSLCPMLTYSANEMLLAHGSPEQQATYLEKLVRGDWTGTMVLTEPHAGSDVGALTTRAEPSADGSWRLFGTKIFITWGEHDLTENIVHIVLARTPGSPPGTKGISCFIVPKFLVEADGSPGERNDVVCVSVEHKVGIHASPTCTLSFGERGDGAVGFMIGEEHQGMRYMFTMMNLARLLVGLEGLAVAERAYQQAAAYARERQQGRAPGDEEGPSPIVRHPDVRHMLMAMRSRIHAMRCLMYRNAAAIDVGESHPDEATRRAEHDLAGLLTPLSKAWGTDVGVDIASLGIQVHGGAGYVEETGAAQLWRDARIAPIYEGTNGIQAIDLVQRKLPIDGGDTVRRVLEEARAEAAALPEVLASLSLHLGEAITATEKATEHVLSASRTDALAAATRYTAMLATTAAGWLVAVSGRAATEGRDGYEPSFLEDRIALARFYAEHVLSAVPGMLPSILAGSDSVFGIPEERM